MMKPLLLIFVYLLSFQLLSSQEIKSNLKDLFLDAEYFFLYEEYEEALYSYNTIYKRGAADNGNINFRIGQCYLNISGEKHRAIPYLEKAVQNMTDKYTEGSYKETKAPYEAQFYLGKAYRITNQLDAAISAYEKYKTLVNVKDLVALKLADKEIQACKNAKQIMNSPVEFSKHVLNRPINTVSKDYFPAISGTETELVYNSSQKFYQAIFFSKRVNNKWSSPLNITPQLESDGNQFVSSLSFDGSQLFLRMEDNFQANIMVSNYENGRWSKSKPLNKNINTKYWEGNACITKDGTTLYFSSNRSGGLGVLDIYKSQRDAKGDWGAAVNLGDIINTEFNEDAPCITEDGKRLYFVSQGHNTIGGYDVFYSDIKEDGSLSTPVNLGYPINTTDDEVFYYPVKNGKVAYLSLYSKDGMGNEDIVKYYFSKEDADIDEAVEKTPKTIAKEELKERVLSSDVQKALAKADSQVVEKKEEGQNTIVSRAIFFDFNSAVLTDKAKRELDHIVNLTKVIPSLKFELNGYTDAKGSQQYNLKLSEQRAMTARDYLVKKGVSSNRVSVKGFGAKSFIAINNNPDGSDNPSGRLYNRRVEISLIGGESVVVKEVEVPSELKAKE